MLSLCINNDEMNYVSYKCAKAVKNQEGGLFFFKHDIYCM